MFSFFKKEKYPTQKQSESQHDTLPSPSEYLLKTYNKEIQFSKRKDYYRTPLAYENGGLTCEDQKQVEKLRSVGKEMIKLIGKKILSGQLNLTKISFPIKACEPKTALLNSIQCCTIFPYFMNLATEVDNYLEKFKLSITAFLSSTYYLKMFLKPLNPILGETLQAELKDGTKIYCEQISHHPPISYFLIYGPNQSYQFSGYYDFDVSPGFNSLSLKNKGKRKVVFKDGTTIESSYAEGNFSSTFFGTSRISQESQFTVKDIQFGKIKKMPSDYFQSDIVCGQKKIAKIKGTYCGYIQVDNIRYWDARDFEPYDIFMCENKLDSDWSHRSDLKQLKKGDIENGQTQKERLEQIQRHDAKLRKKHKKKKNKE